MELYQNDVNHDFEYMLKQLLDSIVNLMSDKGDTLLREQGACLKYLPSTIPDILLVYGPKELRWLN